MFVLERKMYFPEKMVEKLLFLLPARLHQGGLAPEKMSQMIQQDKKHRNKIKQARKVRDFPDLFSLKAIDFTRLETINYHQPGRKSIRYI